MPAIADSAVVQAMPVGKGSAAWRPIRPAPVHARQGGGHRGRAPVHGGDQGLDHGEIMFHRSGGRCDGSSPMCYPKGEFRPRERGRCGGVDFRPAVRGLEAHPADPRRRPGRGSIFSLDNGRERRFLIRSPRLHGSTRCSGSGRNSRRRHRPWSGSVRRSPARASSLPRAVVTYSGQAKPTGGRKSRGNSGATQDDPPMPPPVRLLEFSAHLLQALRIDEEIDDGRTGSPSRAHDGRIDGRRMATERIP